jgi:hypothetical protein
VETTRVRELRGEERCIGGGGAVPRGVLAVREVCKDEGGGEESVSNFLHSVFLRLKVPKLQVPMTQSSYSSKFLRSPYSRKFPTAQIANGQVPMGKKFLQ